MSNEFMDYINRTPVTFGVIGVYVLMAFVTDIVSPTTEQILEYGAASGLLIQDGEIWRLISHCFLHGAWFHLALNAYALFILGPFLELRLGSLKFAVLYLAAGLAGGLAALVFQHPFSTLVGGSGSIFGMLGAILASNMRSGRHPLDVFSHPATRIVLILLGINLAIGIVANFLPLGFRISNSAHIGGLVGGFVVTFCFLDRGRFKPDAVSRAIQAGWIAFTIAMIFYVRFPVLRFDYHLKMSFLAETQEARDQYNKLIGNARDEIIQQVKADPYLKVYEPVFERWEQGR